MSEVVNYSSLVTGYYENLHTTLRKFSPGPAYLESWVHDENHERSLIGLFESAEDSGLEELTVQIAPEVAAEINSGKLASELQSMGSVEIKNGGEIVNIHLKFTRLPPTQSVHPAYEKSLRDLSRPLKHAGRLSVTASNPNVQYFSASYEGVTLYCGIDKNSQVVEACFEGAVRLTSALMDQFCELLIGRPLQEMAEHGVIRLEQLLRDPSAPRTVAGIVSPENADPIFAIPLKLIREIHRSYLKETGHSVQWNNWEDRISPAWRALPEEEKVAKITSTLNAMIKEMSLPCPELTILALKYDYRVVLEQPGKTNLAEFGHQLLMLELGLQQRLEPRLELVLESLADKNHRESRTKRESTFNDRPTNA